MKNFLQVFKRSFKEIFKKKQYLLVLLFSFSITFFLFILIPVFIVPKNNLKTQLLVFQFKDYLLILVLSFLFSIFLAMQIYLFFERKNFITTSTKLVSTGIGTIFVGLLGTATCISCLALPFALLGVGFGTMMFFLNYRWYFVGGMILFMFMAIYLTARKINKTCRSC